MHECYVQFSSISNPQKCKPWVHNCCSFLIASNSILFPFCPNGILSPYHPVSSPFCPHLPTAGFCLPPSCLSPSLPLLLEFLRTSFVLRKGSSLSHISEPSPKRNPVLRTTYNLHRKRSVPTPSNPEQELESKPEEGRERAESWLAILSVSQLSAAVQPLGVNYYSGPLAFILPNEGFYWLSHLIFNFVLLFNWWPDQVPSIFLILEVHLKSHSSSLILFVSWYLACLIFKVYFLCDYWCWSMCGLSAYLLRSKDNFQEWVLPFHQVDLKDQSGWAQWHILFLAYQVNSLSSSLMASLSMVSGIRVFIG